MEISLRQIELKSKFIRALLNNNIILVSHLVTFNGKRLAKRTKLSSDECDEILNAIKPKRPHRVMKASELMARPFDRIPTLIKELDDQLGSGVKCGQVTQFSGESAAGKSSICAQMGVMVMLPKSILPNPEGGFESDVLFIHTEGEGKLVLAIKRFQGLAKSVNVNIDKKLHVMNCSNEYELLEIVNRLPSTLKEIPAVKLIIIDSMTCAFISLDENPDMRFYAKRSRILTRIVKKLNQIAWENRIAVVVTNHVSYNVKEGETQPAMGKLWSHMCQTKIYLQKGPESGRTASVTKGVTTGREIVNWTIQETLNIAIKENRKGPNQA